MSSFIRIQVQNTRYHTVLCKQYLMYVCTRYNTQYITKHDGMLGRERRVRLVLGDLRVGC